MELRALTALTQDTDISFDPEVSNVILKSNQSPRAPYASQAGEAFGAGGIRRENVFTSLL